MLQNIERTLGFKFWGIFFAFPPNTHSVSTKMILFLLSAYSFIGTPPPVHSLTPLFIVGFGETLNKFAESSKTATSASDAPSLVNSISNLVVEFAIIGVGAGGLGFAVVALWSSTGERQVGCVQLG